MHTSYCTLHISRQTAQKVSPPCTFFTVFDLTLLAHSAHIYMHIVTLHTKPMIVQWWKARKVVHSLVPGVTRLARGDHRHPWPLMIVYISDQIFHPISLADGFSVTSWGSPIHVFGLLSVDKAGPSKSVELGNQLWYGWLKGGWGG